MPRILLILMAALSAAPALASSTAIRSTVRAPYLIEDPIPLVTEIIEQFKLIKRYVYQPHRARLTMLNLYVERVLAALLDPHRGLGHKDTMEAFMDVINALDASESYFKLVSSGATQDSIARVMQIRRELAVGYGFDRSTYTLNIHRLLTQMKVLFDELSHQPISDRLSRKIRGLVFPLGFGTAKASTGDRPEAFAAAAPIADEVKAMYEDFASIGASRDAYQIALMIQFLNERLLDYGQYDRELSPGVQP